MNPRQTISINVPSIQSSATALASNVLRMGWMIQNLGTNPLFVSIGGTASTSVFHIVLKAGSGQDDGTGGTYSEQEGVISTLAITVAGTSPRYTVMEK